MHELIAQAERLRELVEQSATTVTSEDHLVTVTIGPGNAVLALTIDHRARRLSGEELGATIIQTARDAADRAVAEFAATVGNRLPPGTAGILRGGLPDVGDLESGLEGLEALAEPGGLDQLDGLDELDEQPGMPGPDSPLAVVRRLRAEVARVTVAYAAVREAVAELSVTGEAGKGSVQATIGAGGVLTGIEIDDRAMRHGMGRLAELVLGAIRDANARLSLRMADAVAGLTGPRLDIKEIVRRYVPDDGDSDIGPGIESETATGCGFGGGFGDAYDDEAGRPVR